MKPKPSERHSRITEEVLWSSSIYRRQTRLTVAGTYKNLVQHQVLKDEQKYLQLLQTEPVFEVEQVAYLDNGTPFEYSINITDTIYLNSIHFALRHSS